MTSSPLYWNSKNETAAMLVFQTNPVRVEHFCIDASHVIETALCYLSYAQDPQ